jgi:regulator of protease activity HflC (stomatin/prohibitin superfamily)
MKNISDNETSSSSSDSSDSECSLEQPKTQTKQKKPKEPKDFIPDIPPPAPKKRVYTRKAQTKEEAEIIQQKKIDNLAKAREKRKLNLEAKKKALQAESQAESQPIKDKKEKPVKKEKVVNYITNNYVTAVEDKPKKPKPSKIVIPPSFNFV